MATTLEEALQTNIASPLPFDLVSTILSQPPFISIDGACNCRDTSSNYSVRPGFVYRSATLEAISERGKQDIKALGVKTIFDLRSAREVDASPDPEIEGVEVVSAALEATTTPADAARFSTLPEMYMDMLTTHRAAWKAILTHVRDHPDRPMLLHCTGGKDRTGIAAILLLALAGASREDIAREYALSRIGIEPGREMLTKKMTGGREVDMQSERFQAIAKITQETALGFLAEVERQYGGVGGYAVSCLDFSENDLANLKAILVSGYSG